MYSLATLHSSAQRLALGGQFRETLEARRTIARAHEPDHNQEKGDRIESQSPRIRRVDRARRRLRLVQRAPPAYRHVDDRDVEGAKNPDDGAPSRATIGVIDEAAQREIAHDDDEEN